jgi:hypothetical protein
MITAAVMIAANTPMVVKQPNGLDCILFPPSHQEIDHLDLILVYAFGKIAYYPNKTKWFFRCQPYFRKVA